MSLRLLKQKWLYYKSSYKKAVFTLMCIWRHRVDSRVASLPYEVLLRIITISPDKYDFQGIDAGTILICHEDNSSSKINARMAIEQISRQYMQSVLYGCYSGYDSCDRELESLRQIKGRQLMSLPEQHNTPTELYKNIRND